MTVSIPADSSAQGALAHYGRRFAESSWTALGNAGGFSGAQIWRGEIAGGDRYCLRAWPSGKMTEERLPIIHQAMAALGSLTFVPDLVRTTKGVTWVSSGENLWEITDWMPGKSDFHANQNNARLFAAMRALAMMHEKLKPTREVVAPAPAVKRILRALRNWRELLQSGWKPNFKLPQPGPITGFARRAWKAISSNTYSIEFTLMDWETRPLPVQLCLCDVWHDHILFEGDAVTGVIDYGAVKPDCVAVDLARLLGSMIPDQPERMHDALSVYSAIHPVPSEVLKLTAVLDHAGSTIGLTNWLRWLYLDTRNYSESASVAKRMQALLKRVETKQSAAFSSWS
jgi:thiamine kinase-like enzyme